MGHTHTLSHHLKFGEKRDNVNSRTWCQAVLHAADVPGNYTFETVAGISLAVGLAVLTVTWSPRDPRFSGSNPADFFQDVKILSTSPPGGTLSSLKSLKAEKIEL